MVDLAVHAGPLIAADIKVAAVSVDGVERTAELKAGLRVGFPMYAELDAVTVAKATGAFLQTGDRTFLQATGFLLRPDGTVDTAAYSTGPIGRITGSDLLRKVTFERSR